MNMGWRWLAVALLVVSSPITETRAQSDYPNKTIRIIVDSAAGSANDATARILADKLSTIWGQPVVTLNQPGAGGGIAARVASQSPNDGYSLYLPSTSTFLALPGGAGVAPNMPVEVPRDFASIGFVLQQPIFIGASHKSGIANLKQLIEMAKQKPNEITYAATGRGRLTHLTMELLQARAGIKLQLVPYAGGPAQAMNDVMSGRVHLVLDAYAGLAAALRGDLIKGLADTSLERLPGFENLPTVAETVPDFFVGAWTVMLAPTGTPDAILRKVNKDLWTALSDPEVKGKFQANGAFVKYMTPEQTTAFVQGEQKTWRPILEQVARETPK
ncbi:MAG: tripartite tricarboxylate transporter substrate-binding protein [Alphaproteobacteria bacterium]|nr:tripartite tricarboxylate transporter substrate-binding protein [Alphaproteobacteria bacterium]